MKTIFSKLKKFLIILVIFSYFTSVILIGNGYAISEKDEILISEFNFKMIESSFSQGNFQDASFIDIELPSPSWNINNIEINFTDMKFDTEIKIIEDNPIDKELINKHNEGFGVQIKIIDPTIIQAIQIYGNNLSTENIPIYISIYGYDDARNAPNNTLYSLPTRLNMSFSNTPSWHLQTFDPHINLNPGNYFLTIDGSSIGNSPHSNYSWYFNDLNPRYPDLYISGYDSVSWSEGIQDSPFLYKLKQRINISVFPENINMTAQINENSYAILNGESQGQGYLKKQDFNYHPYTDFVNIRFINNKSADLFYNATYKFEFKNILNAPCQLKAKNNGTNEWKLFPEITRASNNHYIKFQYPNSWYNLKIFKNQINITAEVIIDTINKFIIIPNEIIQDGFQWEIQANSPNVKFKLNTPKTEFNAGQNLQFSIEPPILTGNYTFKLFNSVEIEIFNITKELPLQENVFQFKIPLNSVEGNYFAYVLWSNKTDAGVQTAIFEITIQPTNTFIDFTIFIIVGSIITGGLVIGGSSYVTIKRIESKKRENIRLILEKCTEIMSLKHIIVLHNKSGIDVYSQSFEDEELDPTLISGFLQAIHNFGTEVIEKTKETRTLKVEYQNSIILMTEFVNLKLIIIMGKNPSKNFIFSVESLAYYIFKYYGKLLDNFNGALAPFQGIGKLVEKILNVSFISPLKIEINKNYKLSQDEKQMVNRASKFMKENDFDYFYSLYLLPDNACSPKDYETILKLIEKGIFKPIEIDTN
ncbi:MAG: hypothetical protein ACFFEY_13595 [Candidatus Thorarchaeota archaeon]